MRLFVSLLALCGTVVSASILSRRQGAPPQQNDPSQEPGEALPIADQFRVPKREALGRRFEIRAFHDTVLQIGAVPLPVLTARIDRFIAEGGASPYPAQAA